MDKLGNRYLRREALRERVSVEELWGKFPVFVYQPEDLVDSGPSKVSLDKSPPFR